MRFARMISNLGNYRILKAGVINFRAPLNVVFGAGLNSVFCFKLDFFGDSLFGLSFGFIVGAIYRKGDFTGFHVVPGQISSPKGVR